MCKVWKVNTWNCTRETTPLHSTPLHATPRHATPLHSTPLTGHDQASCSTVCEVRRVGTGVGAVGAKGKKQSFTRSLYYKIVYKERRLRASGVGQVPWRLRCKWVYTRRGCCTDVPHSSFASYLVLYYKSVILQVCIHTNILNSYCTCCCCFKYCCCCDDCYEYFYDRTCDEL